MTDTQVGRQKIDPKKVAARILELKRPAETDAKFAARLTVDRGVISNWSNGHNGASLDMLALAVRTIHANPLYLLFGDGAPELVEPGRAEAALREIRGIAEAAFAVEATDATGGEKADSDSLGLADHATRAQKQPRSHQRPPPAKRNRKRRKGEGR